MQPFQRHEQNCDNVYSYHITLHRKQTTTLNSNSIIIHCLGDQKQFIGLWHLLTETSAQLQFNSLQNVPNSVLFWVHCWLRKKRKQVKAKQSNQSCSVCKREGWMEGKRETEVQKQNHISPPRLRHQSRMEKYQRHAPVCLLRPDSVFTTILPQLTKPIDRLSELCVLVKYPWVHLIHSPCRKNTVI